MYNICVQERYKNTNINTGRDTKIQIQIQEEIQIQTLLSDNRLSSSNLGERELRTERGLTHRHGKLQHSEYTQ